jgi:predicted amidohydrolase YtcJ
MHPGAVISLPAGLALDRTQTIEDWLEAIAEYAEENEEMPYIYGSGFVASSFGPDGPTKELLDKIVPNKPVLFIDEGGHSAWVNSKTLEFAGVSKDTPDPIPGIHYYQRDSDGNPTGWCKEAQTFFPIMKKLDFIKVEESIERADDFFWSLTSAGLTTVYDAGMIGFEEEAYQALQILEKQGKLPFRVVGSYMVQDPKQIVGAIDQLNHLKEAYESELIKPRVIKIHNDGTIEAYTAGLFDDYDGQKGNKGAVLLTGGTLIDFITAIDVAGFDVHIHAIGDRAINEALNAFEIARQKQPNSKNRFSIAHNQMVIESDLPRFGQLDVVAQATPFWFGYLDESTNESIITTEPVGERANQYNRFKSIQKYGGKVSFGSDFPVTGHIAGLFPTANIEMGITRKFIGKKNAPVTPPIDETLSLETMIKGYTLNAAYQLNMENEIGSITVGKKADLVVLQENIFDIDTYDIHKVRVEMTMMNGKFTYERSIKSWFSEWTLGL